MKEKEKDKISREDKQLVIFKLGEEEFGVDILKVSEIEKLDQGVTRVPKAPQFVEGVINLRGEIIPIIDLRKRFGLVAREIGFDSRVMIVEVNGNRVGMMVDSVMEVTRINSASIETAPAITKGVDSYYLNGVAKIGDRLIILLDLERALSDEESSELGKLKTEAKK